MLIQPRRGLLQLAADLVLGEQIKYAGLDSAFLAHYRSGGGRSLWPQQPKIYPTLSGPACAKTPIPQMFQNVSVCGRKLASVGRGYAPRVLTCVNPERSLCVHRARGARWTS